VSRPHVRPPADRWPGEADAALVRAFRVLLDTLAGSHVALHARSDGALVVTVPPDLAVAIELVPRDWWDAVVTHVWPWRQAIGPGRWRCPTCGQLTTTLYGPHHPARCLPCTTITRKDIP
jgi:hypothetical protein